MLLCSISLFTACSSDDEPAYPIDQEIAGTYKGALNIKIAGIEGEYNLPKNVTMTAAGKNLVNLEIKDFSFGALNLGTITLTNCEIQKSGNSYTFATTQTLTLANPIGACPVTASGTITDGKLDANIDVTVPALSQTVKVKCQGSKLKGNESSEAKITGFTFDSPFVTAQPVIDEANGTITFKVSEQATSSDLQLTPSITISDKATVNPATGVAQDFSGNNVVEYTVVAEDGTIKIYRASVAGTNNVVSYKFEDWTVDTSNTEADYQYPILQGGWASCNQAVVFIKGFGSMAVPPINYTGGYPINKTTEAHAGTYAAEMISVDTQGSDNMLGQKVPKVTAGSLYLGKFNAMAALVNPMNTTEFGVAYDKKPLTVKGFFKYTPGTQYFDANGQIVAAKKDTCSISAVLYEVQNDREVLNGSTIYTSDKIVASAMFTNPRADQYTPFQLNLVYRKDFDPTKKYKFTIIFSSSKDGASYNAAVGSRLLVDDVMVINQ